MPVDHPVEPGRGTAGNLSSPSPRPLGRIKSAVTVVVHSQANEDGEVRACPKIATEIYLGDRRFPGYGRPSVPRARPLH